MACKETRGNAVCDSVDSSSTCNPHQLSLHAKKELCQTEKYIEEHIRIGGADVLIFKLLGVHEQGELVDLAKKGKAISSSFGGVFVPDNAFTVYDTDWRSGERGQEVLDKAYIGYDFGQIKLDDVNRLRYGIDDVVVRQNIGSIKIKQSSVNQYRATKVRLERSEDGVKWYGAGIATLPNDDKLNLIHFRKSAPARYWRLRPVAFNGGSNDFWSVVALELFDYDLTTIDDIQDDIFQENRDRDYATQSLKLKAQYDLMEPASEFSKWGLDMTTQSYYLNFAFNAVVQELNRPIVVGDILELPSETQFSFDMTPIKKYLEVTDVTWASEGFTAGYVPTILKVTAQPVIASQETADLFDNIFDEIEGSGLDISTSGESGDFNHQFQNYDTTSQVVEATAAINNPENHSDPQNIQHFSDEQIEIANEGNVPLEKLNIRQNSKYVEDALPPNGEPYTQGDELPDIATATNGDYHRLTYSSVGDDIPARLFRFSVKKGRWIYLETDRRAQATPIKPVLTEYFKKRNNPINNDDI
jgi:hypothetical protein